MNTQEEGRVNVRVQVTAKYKIHLKFKGQQSTQNRAISSLLIVCGEVLVDIYGLKNSSILKRTD